MKINKILFILALIIYSLAGVFLLKYYQYQINPDAIAYISIAKKYLAGDFNNAVNGYWGPLFSWLLLPFLYLQLPPLLLVKIMSIIIGAFTITGVILLSYRFEINNNIRTITVFFILIPAVLSFALTIITPDLLLLCLLAYYLNIILRSNYATRTYDGLLCGIIGSFAYLSKSYALPFFLTHFIIFNAIYYIKGKSEDKKNTLKTFIFGLLVLSVISGIWIYQISNKYGYITTGTAGKFNYALIGPDSKSYSTLDGKTNVLREPTNDTAIYAFEDPCINQKITTWSPVDSFSSFIYQLKLIFKNIFNIILMMPTLLLAIIIGYTLLLGQPHNKVNYHGITFHPLLTIILYSIGYTPFLIMERYLWIVYILLMLMGCCLMSILFNSDYFSKTKKYIILILFILSFTINPMDQLIHNTNAGKDAFVLAKELDEKYKIKGNIASNTNRDKSLFLSFHLNSRYFGYYDNVDPKISDQELYNDLIKHKIDYYLVWDGPNSGSGLLNAKEITVETKPSLRIYSLKEDVR